MSASNSERAIRCLHSVQWVMIAARSGFGSIAESITIPTFRDLIVRLDGLLSAITRSEEYRTALMELARAHPYLGGIVVRFDADPCEGDKWTMERCRQPCITDGSDAWEMSLCRVACLREAIGLAGTQMLERGALTRRAAVSFFDDAEYLAGLLARAVPDVETFDSYLAWFLKKYIDM